MAIAEARPVTYRCTCGRCGTRFTLVSTIGKSNICDMCARTLLAIIWPQGIPTIPRAGNHEYTR